MDFLPLHFDLKGQACLLVGGGAVALRKATLLSAAGASVNVVAPEISADFSTLANTRIDCRPFDPADIEGKTLVVAATDDSALNETVSTLCRARHIPVNVVDQPNLCSVIFPAIVDRSPVLISVATGGASPVLTRALREMLESLIGTGYSRLARYLGSKRAALKIRYPDVDRRRRLTENFLTSTAASQVMVGREAGADAWFESDEHQASAVGEVYVVGAGPGDPDLLTLRALQLMQRADVVLYDSLVSAPILDRVRRDARKLFVGKQKAAHAVPQEDLNRMMVELAQAGQRVLRLKGGDPFVFGRGGEELETLAANHIPFQVVPGITAANGCASYAGIPLTHRDYSQSVQFVTGHPKEGQVHLEWHKFAQPNQTLVFYMGLGGLSRICDNLIEHGKSPETPAALIEKGTLPDQRVITGTLATLPGLVEEHDVTRPTLVIVGEVVKLRTRLNWFR